MGQNQKLSFIVCIFVLCSANVFATGRYVGKPEILSKFETIIEANDNYTVFCQGNKPLKWTVPEVSEEYRTWTTFSTARQKPANGKFSHGIQLKIFNMSYPFIGFYRCHYEDSDVYDDEESSNIYLFVNDPEHLTTLKLDDNIEHVTVTQYHEAVIPCRPTSPDVKVTLTTFDGDPVKLDGLSEGTLYRYDPLYGFLTNNTRNVHKDHIYECTFKKNGTEQIALVKVIVEIYASHLALPFIRDLSEGHTIVGQTLVLECTIKSQNYVYFHWQTPTGPLDNSRMSTSQVIKDEKKSETLRIFNTTAADNGTYHCNVTDNQKHSSSYSLGVKIFNEDQHYLNVKQEYNVDTITATAGDKSINWSVTVEGHPIPSVTWLNNRNETIPLANGTKYDAFYKSSDNTAFLTIKDIQIRDFGNYTLLASNNKSDGSLSFFLNVTDKPTVDLQTEPFYMVNNRSVVRCSAYANPEPEILWYFKPGLHNSSQYLPVNGTVSKTKGFEFVSEVTLNGSQSGYLKCFARNSEGKSEDVKAFHVSDVKNGFDIFDLDNNLDFNEDHGIAVVANGDNIRVICGASKENYSQIYWTFNGVPIKASEKYELYNSSTQYSQKIHLTIQHSNFSDSGLYSCIAANTSAGDKLYKNLTITVKDPEAPRIVNTTLRDVLETEFPDRLEMYCKFSGIPKPSLVWYKNGAVFHPTNSKRINVSENKEKIVFVRTAAEDEGDYKCEATNRISSAYRQQTLKFENLPKDQSWLIAVSVLLGLISVGAIIFIVIKTRREKELQNELKKMGLSNFEKGAVENINPELGIDDQAELLPYDKKWEFPIENLKLGKQLGSGAFGVVMKGLAKHIVEGEDETTVAVKMVKKNADSTYIRALASELKIMVHLGKHLNVVNLLGACTKNVVKKELLVIVEFCRFGNIQNYLLRHRDNYIDQVDPKTGRIDYVIGQEFFSRTYSVSSDRSNSQSPLLKYAALAFSNSGNQPVLPPPSNMGDYRANTEMSTATDMTTVSQGEDGVVLSNNSVQPEWRSNYKGDYKGNVKPICTKDLLAWAFQVARGMEYLASRKVLHGDLAARNILLADNNVVKICDFGLAKSMYKCDNYKKRGDGPLPVKWMAIESIRDRVFSTQSDVWSFGIVLWEFFSLARTPYPGMEADERLYQKLVDGYRMESPQFAPKEIYKMMTDCWAAKPLARPTFTRLSERLGTLLENSVRKLYIDLNDPYLVMNTQRLEDGQSDYLAMLSPPTFEALSTPHYVNDMVGQESLEDSGYLSMKPNTIFSPRVEEGQMFDFNVNNRKHLNSEEGNTMELLPMLRTQSDSGCETPLQSPTSPNSFSNPSYHIPPKIEEEEGKEGNNNTDIVKSPDNYVNMPQNKNIVKEKVSQNNPFVDSNGDAGSSPYVNSCSRDWGSVKV